MASSAFLWSAGGFRSRGTGDNQRQTELRRGGRRNSPRKTLPRCGRADARVPGRPSILGKKQVEEEDDNDSFAAKLKKRTLTNLHNERPTWLDLAHKNLDAAVLAAYGWPEDISDDQILALRWAQAATERIPAASCWGKSLQRLRWGGSLTLWRRYRRPRGRASGKDRLMRPMCKSCSCPSWCGPRRVCDMGRVYSSPT
jgi:hypothetical protein